MTTSSAGDRPGPSGPTGRSKPTRVVRALAAAGLAAGLVAGYWVWQRGPVPDPPAVELTGADPDVARAVEAARARVQGAPRSALAWGQLGMVLHAHDFLAPANRCYEQAERLDPRDPRWPYLRGQSLLMSHLEPVAALRSLERAAELCGDEAAPRLLLGEALLEQGRLDEAEGQFHRVETAHPADPRAHLGLGQVAYLRDDLKGSRYHLLRSASEAPRVRATHALLAEIHWRLGDKEDADAERRRAAQSAPEPGWPDPYLEQVLQCATGALARIDRANWLSRQGRGAEALALLRQTAQEHPDSAQAHLMLGRTLIQLGRPGEAEPELREAVRLKPDAVSAQFELGVSLQLQGDYRAAAECYRQATRLKPDFAPGRFNLGHCLLKEGDRAGAVEAFREAVRYKPDLAEGHRDLGDLLAQNGQRAEALVHLQHAVRLNPDDARARELLAQVSKTAAVPAGP